MASVWRNLAIAALIAVVATIVGCSGGNTLEGRPETGYGTGGDSVGFKNAEHGQEHETTETTVPGGV